MMEKAAGQPLKKMMLVIEEAAPEKVGLDDDDDDDTATEVLDVAAMDRVRRNADGSSPID